MYQQKHGGVGAELFESFQTIAVVFHVFGHAVCFDVENVDHDADMLEDRRALSC